MNALRLAARPALALSRGSGASVCTARQTPLRERNTVDNGHRSFPCGCVPSPAILFGSRCCLSVLSPRSFACWTRYPARKFLVWLTPQSRACAGPALRQKAATPSPVRGAAVVAHSISSSPLFLTPRRRPGGAPRARRHGRGQADLVRLWRPEGGDCAAASAHVRSLRAGAPARWASRAQAHPFFPLKSQVRARACGRLRGVHAQHDGRGGCCAHRADQGGEGGDCACNGGGMRDPCC